MELLIIVEGKNDRKRIRRLIQSDAVEIVCTFGTPSTDRLEELRVLAAGHQVCIWTDNDASGKKLRAMLGDLFPDAEHLYTKKGYAGVEGTPDEYVIRQLEKLGIEDLIIYPEHDQSVESLDLR